MSYDFLRRAERYSESKGDEILFREVYSKFRERFNITESTWRALEHLYSDVVADDIEDQSTPARGYSC